MILFRSVTSKELLNMLHGNNVKINATIQGENTFRYDNGVDYMHFFKYAEHAFYYKNEKNVIAVMECIIPDIIIEQKGFGYYGGVKTKKNSELFGYYMPLPEYIIKRDNFDMKYIYDVNNWLHPKYIRKELNGSDNEIYGEAIEAEFALSNNGYCDCKKFTYADIYYEIVYKLFIENDYCMDDVTKILLKMDLNKEIILFFNENRDYLLELYDNMENLKKNSNNKFCLFDFKKIFKKESGDELIKKYIKRNKF